MNQPIRTVKINQKSKVPLEPQLKVALIVKIIQKIPNRMDGSGEVDCLFIKTSI